MRRDHSIERRTTAEIRQRLRNINAIIATTAARPAPGSPPPQSRAELLAERNQLEIILATRRAERAKPVISLRRWRDGAFQ
jgi:hypothetical protein